MKSLNTQKMPSWMPIVAIVAVIVIVIIAGVAAFKPAPSQLPKAPPGVASLTAPPNYTSSYSPPSGAQGAAKTASPAANGH